MTSEECQMGPIIEEDLITGKVRAGWGCALKISGLCGNSDPLSFPKFFPPYHAGSMQDTRAQKNAATHARGAKILCKGPKP